MVLILFLIGMVGIIAAFLLQILKISSTRRKNNIIVMILGAVSLAMIIWGIIIPVSYTHLTLPTTSRV